MVVAATGKMMPGSSLRAARAIGALLGYLVMMLSLTGFGRFDPDYSLIFIVSFTGIVMTFYGFFGRDFVLNPLFVLGMLLVSWGYPGTIVGYLGTGSCGSTSIPVFCPAYRPEYSLGIMVFGMITIGGFTRRWQRSPG